MVDEPVPELRADVTRAELRALHLKRCSRCKVIKRIAAFASCKRNGTQSWCRACIAENHTKNHADKDVVARRLECAALAESRLKRCMGCGEIKPFSLFSRSGRGADGLEARCKSCRGAYYTENFEYFSRKGAEYRQLNQPYLRAYNAAYYIENAVELNRKTAEYRRANPDMVRAFGENHRARKRNAPGKHTATDIDFLMKTQGGKCAHLWCRKSLKKARHTDHIMPLSKGGSNDRKNLQLLCPTCNHRKSAKHPTDFAQANGMLL